jgi:hypothetical protein
MGKNFQRKNPVDSCLCLAQIFSKGFTDFFDSRQTREGIQKTSYNNLTTVSTLN